MGPLNNRSKRKRLLVLTSTFPRWEGDREPPFVFELSRRLKAHYDIDVLAPHARGSAKEEQLGGLHVKRFRYFFSRWENLAYQGGVLERLKDKPLRFGLVPFFLVAELFALIRLLRSRPIDLIHAHWLIPQGLVALLARLFIKPMPPLLCTSHGGDLYGLQGRFFRPLKCFVLNHASAVTVVSRAMGEEVGRYVGDDVRVRVIPMGVDLQHRFVPPDVREESASLLFVGRLVEKKGVGYLIDALPEILAKHPHVKLRIAGDGPEETPLRHRVSRLGLDGSVRFLGAVENNALPALYQSSDAVIFPSVIADDGDREGFGLVLVEALGCECAAVVTDLAAMQDIIADGKTGLVVPQKNAEALAEKVVYLLDNPSLARSLGKKGRQYVVERYDWDRIVRQHVALIESTCHHPSALSNRS